MAIWDQEDNSAEVSENVAYGREYRREEINRALDSDDPESIVPQQDTNGHGTYVASVAAGSALDNGAFIGAAYEASIAVVKLKQAKPYLKEFFQIYTDAPCYQENDIMSAISYLDKLAEENGMPLVIGLALGTNMGDHGGNSPLGNCLNEFTRRVGHAAVAGTGNEADARHHYYGTMAQENSVDEVEIRVDEQTEGFSLELWSEAYDSFTVSVKSPSGEVIPRIPLQVGYSGEFRFVFEETIVYIDYRVVEVRAGSELIVLRFRQPSPGIWTIFVYNGSLFSGRYHMWLPIRQFMDGDTYFLRSDPDVTLTEPSAVESIITVSAYDSRNDGIIVRSGRGYARANYIKPEIAAPGEQILGVQANGQLLRMSGSSSSTALTMGACALMLSWGIVEGKDLMIDTVKIKNYFIRGARRDPEKKYPNRMWGYGTLDLYGVFQNLRIM